MMSQGRTTVHIALLRLPAGRVLRASVICVIPVGEWACALSAPNASPHEILACFVFAALHAEAVDRSSSSIRPSSSPVGCRESEGGS